MDKHFSHESAERTQLALQMLWRKLLLYDFRFSGPVVFYTSPLRKSKSVKATNHLEFLINRWDVCWMIWSRNHHLSVLCHWYTYASWAISKVSLRAIKVKRWTYCVVHFISHKLLKIASNVLESCEPIKVLEYQMNLLCGHITSILLEHWVHIASELCVLCARNPMQTALEKIFWHTWSLWKALMQNIWNTYCASQLIL
jgi:hypothetical protein